MTDSIVLRGGTVLTMDDSHTVHATGDVLVVGDRIEAVGPHLDVPEGTQEIDASGGIVMPGMIDTHRHMWQTAMRAYGADWTLTQYFVWYYLEHGKTFRPEDIHAGNLLSALGVARGRRHHHRRLVARAADRRPRRRGGRRAAGGAGPVRAGLRQHPGRAVGVDRRPGRPRLLRAPSYRRGRHARLPARLRRDRRPVVPGEGGVRGGPRARPAGHHPRRRLGRDERRRHPADARERVRDAGHHLRARGDAEHRLLPADRGERRLGVGVDGVRAERRARATPRPGRCASYDIPVSLSMDTSVWWSGDLFSAMRTTLGADRSREHLEAHVKGDTVTALSLRAEHVVDWATRGGAHALGRDDLGRLDPRRQGRRRPDQERRLAGLVPAAQPLRPRRVPGPARRRAHGARGRPGREERGPAGRLRRGRRTSHDRRDGRPPARGDGRGRLARRA